MTAVDVTVGYSPTVWHIFTAGDNGYEQADNLRIRQPNLTCTMCIRRIIEGIHVIENAFLQVVFDVGSYGLISRSLNVLYRRDGSDI